MLLQGKIAVISGGAGVRGIGFATAKLFAEQGARVVILDLTAAQSKEAASMLPGDGHLGLACDVTDRMACIEAARVVSETYGRADILINNAGITQPIKFLDIKPENYDAVLDVSLRGTVYLSQAFIPMMRQQGGGSIACTSSVSAQRGGGILGGTHYSAAKAGVLGLAKAMAREFGPDNIRVNCVTPGLIQTDINAGKISDTAKTDILKGIPLGRLGEVGDVAGAFLFLASGLSGYITGAVIDVNGGMLIH